MSGDIINELQALFEIESESFFEFKKVYGFTFVFITRITIIRDQVSSAEIRPAGIIYEENDQYYFAPLDKVDNLEEIIREYVKTI
jgi:hypothetical protein